MMSIVGVGKKMRRGFKGIGKKKIQTAAKSVGSSKKVLVYSKKIRKGISKGSYT